MPEMGIYSILLIALSLSADCFAVALSTSISNRSLRIFHGLRIALFFGVFQAAMTLIGWWAGSYILKFIQGFDHWIAFGLLAFVGGRMIWESFHEEEKKTDITKWRFLFLLAVATSLDALAVGLSFAFLDVNLSVAAAAIGVVAFIITLLGFIAGKKLGELVGKRAEILGGIILIVIGIRILIEHLM